MTALGLGTSSGEVQGVDLTLVSLSSVMVLVQGVLCLFLALFLGTLWLFRRFFHLLAWSLAWFWNGIWLLCGGIDHELINGRGLSPDQMPASWITVLGLLAGLWGMLFWLGGWSRFRSRGWDSATAAQDDTHPTWPQWLLLALPVAVLGTIPVSLLLPLTSARVIVLGMRMAASVWVIAVIFRYGRVEPRGGTLLLGAGLILLLTLKLFGITNLLQPQLFAGSALVGLLPVSSFVALLLVEMAMVLFVLEEEQLDLKKALRQSGDSETRFRLIFEYSGVGMVLLSASGKILQANPAIKRTLGYSDEELSQRRLSDFLDPHAPSTSKVLPDDPQSKEPESYYEREKRYLRKDGSPIWARLVRVPVREADTGMVQYYVGVLMDITERKRAEEALIASEQRLRLFNEGAGDGILVTDDQGVILEGNPYFCALLGRLRTEVLQSALARFAEHPEVVERYQKRILQDRGGKRLETRLRRKDGALVDVEMSGVLLNVGERCLVHSICRDITERKRIELNLQETREKLRQERDFTRQILETADVLIVVVDPDGQVVRFNGASARLSGYSERALRGRVFWEVLFVEPHAQTMRQALQKLREERPGLIDLNVTPRERPLAASPVQEIPWRTSSGEDRCIAWRHAAVRDGLGEPRFLISTGIDVTEHRLLEEHLRQARKMEALGTLVGGIAHDFNNQLTAILGNLGLALADLEVEEHTDNPRAHGNVNRALDNAHQAAQRCAEITQRLLTFSHGRLGTPTTVSLAQLVDETVRVLQHRFPDTIPIDRTVAPDVWPVLADQAQLHQVLLNLAANARDAMPDGGHLTFRLANRHITASDCVHEREARPGDFVEITVTDTGTGMSPEVVARLFEPFFTTKTDGLRSGMGLAMVYGLVKAHKGWLTVRSELGQGSTFSVYLPAQEAPPAPPPEPCEAPAQGGSECLLLVDDEELLRSLARLILERKGFRVLVARDGEEALAIYRERGAEIQLVLLDYVMPRLTGLQVFQMLRQIDPEVCVVFSSGYTMDSEVDQLLATGARGFVPKPYRPDDLVRTVRKALDQRRSLGHLSRGVQSATL